MHILQLHEALADEEVAPLLGQWAERDHYVHAIDETTRVNKPNGDCLGILLRGCLDSRFCASVQPLLKTAAGKTDNRGVAAGPLSNKQLAKGIAVVGNRVTKLRMDGTIRKRTRAREVQSGIVGYTDPNGAFPYCRMTAWTLENFAEMPKLMPLLQQADAQLAAHLPERHAAQMEVAVRTSPDFRLGETSFTTVTVNRNFRTAYHRDAGDLKQGFGVMCCMRSGQWTGGWLVVPKYKTAFNMQHGDVLLMDVHEMHGNTAIVPYGKSYERITCVFYFREKVKECGSAEAELAKAKQREPHQDEFRYQDA